MGLYTSYALFWQHSVDSPGTISWSSKRSLANKTTLVVFSMSCLHRGVPPFFLHVYLAILWAVGPWGLLVGSVVDLYQPSQIFCIAHYVGVLAGPIVI